MNSICSADADEAGFVEEPSNQGMHCLKCHWRNC